MGRNPALTAAPRRIKAGAGSSLRPLSPKASAIDDQAFNPPDRPIGRFAGGSSLRAILQLLDLLKVPALGIEKAANFPLLRLIGRGLQPRFEAPDIFARDEIFHKPARRRTFSRRPPFYHGLGPRHIAFTP